MFEFVIRLFDYFGVSLLFSDDTLSEFSEPTDPTAYFTINTVAINDRYGFNPEGPAVIGLHRSSLKRSSCDVTCAYTVVITGKRIYV